MTRSLCNSCGLRSQHCQCDRHEASSTIENANANADGENGRPFKLTPVSSCVFLLIYPLFSAGFFLLLHVLIMSRRECYLEVFADSFSVSNVSTANATADWKVGFATRNLGSSCKASLHVLKSRLLRGNNKLISEPSDQDSFRRVVTGKIFEPLPYAVFKTVKTPEEGGVVWDLRVEVVSSVQVKGGSYDGNGFLTLTCGDIPVKFTVDPAGSVTGSLLGSMRPCDYVLHNDYPVSSTF